LAVILLVLGLALLVVGAEVLVRGAAHLATVLGISPLVVGLTVVAFGTSAPEMAVGARAAAAGRTDLAIGNVVGSNLFNTLAILGVAALITPLLVQQKLVRREVPLVLAASIAVWLLAMDGTVTRVEGAALLVAAIIYTGWAVISERREPAEIAAEYEEEFAGQVPRHWGVDLVLIAVGLALLVLGSTWLVDGAVQIARSLGMSELVIGLTIVAAGTSLPEAATSIVAGIRGQRDIAVGNVVGSNLFNLLVVLGLTSVVAEGGLPAPDSSLRLDLPVLVAVAAICLGVFFTDWTIRRWEGALFLGLYATYLGYLLLDAGGHGAADTIGRLAVFVVLPAATVAVVWQSVRQASAGGRST
jgi:cation:H+ antiporter